MSAVENPIEINYTAGDITLRFEDSANDKTLPLSGGVQLNIVNEEGDLTGDLIQGWNLTPTELERASSATILLHEQNWSGDIIGGKANGSTSLNIEDLGVFNIINHNEFILSIIGVDDIRLGGVGNPPDYPEVFMVENRRVYLKTRVSGTKTFLEIKHIRQPQ